MKKLLLLLLFITGTLYAQPPIAQPNDLIVCDGNGDGFEAFDLTTNEVQTLNGLNPTLYDVRYFNTLNNAQNNTAAIVSEMAYTNLSNPQTIFVRVEEIASGLYSTTSFNLIVNVLPTVSITTNSPICSSDSASVLFTGTPNATVQYTVDGFFQQSVTLNSNGSATLSFSNLTVDTTICLVDVSSSTTPVCTQTLTACETIIVNQAPNIVQPNDMIVYESPFDGSAIFDLTQNEADMANGATGLSFQYYLTLADAQAGTNAIANPTAFTNTSNPQTIFVSVVDNVTGCFSVTNFDLIVALDDIVFIPDTNFKTKLLAADTTNNIASNVNPNNTATWNIYTKVDTNQDGEIQFSEAQAIVFMNLDGSQIVNGGIQSLQGLEAFVNLRWLRSSYNQIATVDLSVCPQLEYYFATNAQIANLILTNCTNLETLNCSYNQLSSIDLTQCPNLRNLVVRNNQLTSLNLDTNQQIQSINAFYNSITSFQIQDKNLRTLQIGFNQLTDLQLNNLPFLYRVEVQNNNLTSVDFSTIAYENEPNNLPQSNILDISVNNNLNLDIINLKNGYANLNVSLASGNLNNTQQYICVDGSDTFDTFFTTPNPIVNSYCSFTPNGNFNTVLGVAQFDSNNNGCDANDVPVQFLELAVNLNAVTTNSSIFTNNVGNYALFASQQGVFELVPNLEEPTYFNITPNPATVTIPVIDNSTTTQNFCITANGVHPDLEIVIVPITPARPGFDAVYKIVYKNKGNQTVDGFVNFTYNDALLDLVSSSVTPTNVGIGSMNWFIPGLVPFQTGSITITLNVNSPQEIPAVNNGDILAFNAFIDVTTDDNWNDNNFDFNQTVVGSYDPNDITCIEGAVVSPSYIGQYLHYVINFENTGTYQAENIVVKTTINPADFDINTLRLLEASHNVITRVNGNIVEFIFQTINLDTGGHGNILLKIRTKDNLVVDDIVSKKADIYFDYNFPIETNFANTTFQVLSNSVVVIDNSVGVYPNPANDVLNIKANSSIRSIEIYDVQGRIILKKILDVENETIDVSGLNKGIYFMMVKTQKGQKVEKVVIE